MKLQWWVLSVGQLDIVANHQHGMATCMQNAIPHGVSIQPINAGLKYTEFYWLPTVRIDHSKNQYCLIEQLLTIQILFYIHLIDRDILPARILLPAGLPTVMLLILALLFVRVCCSVLCASIRDQLCRLISQTISENGCFPYCNR